MVGNDAPFTNFYSRTNKQKIAHQSIFSSHIKIFDLKSQWNHKKITSWCLPVGNDLRGRIFPNINSMDSKLWDLRSMITPPSTSVTLILQRNESKNHRFCLFEWFVFTCFWMVFEKNQLKYYVCILDKQRKIRLQRDTIDRRFNLFNQKIRFWLYINFHWDVIVISVKSVHEYSNDAV